MIEKTEFVQWLKVIRSGIGDWAETVPTDTAQGIWDACDNGLAMMYILGSNMRPSEPKEIDYGGRLFLLTSCLCARLPLYLIRPEEKRPRHLIDVTEDWLKGNGTYSFQDQDKIWMEVFCLNDDTFSPLEKYAIHAVLYLTSLEKSGGARYAAKAIALSVAAEGTVPYQTVLDGTSKKISEIIRCYWPFVDLIFNEKFDYFRKKRRLR